MGDEILEIPADLLHLDRDLEDQAACCPPPPGGGEVVQDLQEVLPVPPLQVDPAVPRQVHTLKEKNLVFTATDIKTSLELV